MLKTFIAIVTVGSLVIGADALAQRDAGAKARREIGRGFWSTIARTSRGQTRQRVATPRYSPPSSPRGIGAEAPSSGSYQRFSFEPAPGADDRVNGAELAAPAVGEGEKVETEGVELQKGTVQPRCTEPRSSSYRRFSFEPAATSTGRSVSRDKSTTRERPSTPRVRLRPGSRRF